MRLVVPYVVGGLQSPTLAAALAYDGQVDLIDVNADGQTYARILADLWQRQESVLIVEQDVVPTLAQLASLASCEHPWCAFTYEPHKDVSYDDPGSIVMLGCCKLSAEFMQATERAWFDLNLPWWHCDVRVSMFGRGAGYTPHQHSPNVQHLNPALSSNTKEPDAIRI